MIDINKEQRRASNPLASVWVSASAGSGKTKVLTDRVLNLLLMTGRPDKLLCLTFTKAAAAEMANRISDVLKKWAICSESELVAEIETLTGEIPEASVLTRARRLFAAVLEAPGGMKIMTIHSFCQSVLQRFPIEAHIPPNFEVMDEQGAQAILSVALQETLCQESYRDDLNLLARYTDEKRLIQLLQELLGERGKLTALLGKGSFKTVVHEIKRYFNIDKYQSEKQIISEEVNENEWADLKTTYLTKDETHIRSTYKEDATALRVWDVHERVRNFQAVQLTEALLHLTFAIMTAYQSQKAALGVLDYDDLIDKTRALLAESGAAAWVLFKLDGGIDHILVDEAQDTNPDQWEIIRLLAEEFFAGEDHHDTIRTIFAVGDKKQSIYSFQGADPKEFERMRCYFEERIRGSENDFEVVPLNRSFRSTRAVLEVVNRVLANPAARVGVLERGEEAVHIAHRSEDAGLVEIWPLETAEKEDAVQPWKPPVERVEKSSAMRRLAERTADKIADMIRRREELPSAGRPVEAGDFLILVQRRNALVGELVRLLKERGVPVAGVDRLPLSAHIVAQDLMAAARFALLPEDDLNLACLLKSPLVKMGEEELFQAAYGREKASLWDRVQTLFPAAADKLRPLLTQSDKVPPYEFFAMILGPMGGRQAFIARLGEEANEALDEFLNLALSFEKEEVPSLQRFADWIGDRDIEIKRDMAQNGLNAVRIMTVHGSKGLQGNIVFLPQTRYVKRQRGNFLWLNGQLPFWIPKKALRSQITEALIDAQDQRDDEESRRLLYVALTRARDRLYICGYENRTKAQAGNWYDLIVSSLPQQADADGIIRIQSTQKRIVSSKSVKERTVADVILPAWAKTAPAPEPLPPRPLAPSRAVETVFETDSPLTSDQGKAMRRGAFIHQLLQYLPDVPVDKWDDVIRRLKPADIDVPNEIGEILRRPDFQILFGEKSLAEVPIVGVWENQGVSGQIDRIVVLPNEVWVIDFKTNRRVPRTTDDVPMAYRRQLEIYRGLIKNIFPDKLVRTYLLWTENLDLMEITE